MNKKVLVVVAHPDDEVLGCGGTIAKHINNGDSVSVLILADGETSRESNYVGQLGVPLEANDSFAVDCRRIVPGVPRCRKATHLHA